MLAAAGVEFALDESGVEEVRLADEPAAKFALRMAEEKALAVSRRAADALVLGADTVVDAAAKFLASRTTAPTRIACCARSPAASMWW